jgi:hypothetical protein
MIAALPRLRRYFPFVADPAASRRLPVRIEQRELRGHPEPVVQLLARARESSGDEPLKVLRAPISTALLLRRTDTPALRRSTAVAVLSLIDHNSGLRGVEDAAANSSAVTTCPRRRRDRECSRDLTSLWCDPVAATGSLSVAVLRGRRATQSDRTTAIAHGPAIDVIPAALYVTLSV